MINDHRKVTVPIIFTMIIQDDDGTSGCMIVLMSDRRRDGEATDLAMSGRS